MKRFFTAIPFWIGLFLFSIYLLSFSGKFHVMDELAVFTAGNNLAQHGRADIDPLIWTNHWTPNPPGIWGQDDHLYTKKAPGISFITAPLIWLGHAIPGFNAVHVGLLTNAIVTALTGALLFIWLRDLSFSYTTATLTALGYGLGTIAWIYARMFWESSLLALAFLAAVWAVYRATRLAYARQRLLWILLGGLAGAAGLTLRFEALPAVIFIAVYLIWEAATWPVSQWLYTRQSRRANETTYHALFNRRALRLLPHVIPWGRLLIYLAPTLLTGLGLLYFNFIRYGSLIETGYTGEFLFEAPWVGGFGLLFSPGRGLFIYAPIMLLLFFGLRPAWNRLSRPYFWLIAALSLFYWLFYGAWFAWGGTWGWGPRFLLPILPLLMLFVAEPIEWAKKRSHEENTLPKKEASPFNPLGRRLSPAGLAWLGMGLLAGLSLLVNFLGIAVDFNEHFLRLGRNDDFVFNWAAFPPVAHWRILQEGLFDIIWLRRQAEQTIIEWAILTPALLLFCLAAGGLLVTLSRKKAEVRQRRYPYQKHTAPRPTLLSLPAQITTSTARLPSYLTNTRLYFLLFVLLPLALIYEVMIGTARLALNDDQTRADMPLLETLTAAAEPDDRLLIPMPPFGDVQELTTRLMAYFDDPTPAAAWIESPPRAIQPAERERIWQTTLAEAERVWLFERWLTPAGPAGPTAVYLNQKAFPLEERWFEQSGKLTLYAIAKTGPAGPAASLDVAFQGGLTLRDFALFNDRIASDEDIVKLRLTWQAAEANRLAASHFLADRIVASVQLLDPEAIEKVAQNDRLLLDPQNFDRSPLRPGQTVQQGYGLRLPDGLPPGAYPLIVTLYQAAGRRLPQAGHPDDFLYLTTVKVE